MLTLCISCKKHGWAQRSSSYLCCDRG